MRKYNLIPDVTFIPSIEWQKGKYGSSNLEVSLVQLHFIRVAFEFRWNLWSLCLHPFIKIFTKCRCIYTLVDHIVLIPYLIITEQLPPPRPRRHL